MDDKAKKNAGKNRDTTAEVKKLEKEIQQLALTIDKVEDEKLQVVNQLKKALADYQNLERDINNRVEVRLIHLKRQVAKSLIEIVDDIKFAVDASAKLNVTGETTSWLQGVLQTLQKVEKAMGELDITLMQVNKGDRFDSVRHEAIGVVSEGEMDCIHDIVQPGYLMGETVVRPARVIVCKPSS